MFQETYAFVHSHIYKNFRHRLEQDISTQTIRTRQTDISTNPITHQYSHLRQRIKQNHILKYPHKNFEGNVHTKKNVVKITVSSIYGGNFRKYTLHCPPFIFSI